MKLDFKERQTDIKPQLHHQKGHCPTFLLNSPKNLKNSSKSSKDIFLKVLQVPQDHKLKTESVKDFSTEKTFESAYFEREISQIKKPRSLNGDKHLAISFGSNSASHEKKQCINLDLNQEDMNLQEKKVYGDDSGGEIHINIKTSGSKKTREKTYFNKSMQKPTKAISTRKFSFMSKNEKQFDLGIPKVPEKTKSAMNLVIPKIRVVSEYRPNKSKIDNFWLLQLLGKGATAKVHLGKHKETHALFAIKIIEKSLLKNSKIKQSLLRQIKNSWKIKDPHVVTLYDFFDDQEKIYLVMEYLKDGSLYDKWVHKKKQINEKSVSKIIADICKGIRALHKHEIIHRDIKPQNIFLQQGMAKIGDLGCSVETTFLRKSMIGSPSYLSPQQLSNHFYNQKIDMWSVGIMTFELLFGYSPYQKDIYGIFVKKEKNHTLPHFKFPDAPEASQSSRDFIEKLLEQKSTRRMDAEQALKHPFILQYSNDSKLFQNIA